MCVSLMSVIQGSVSQLSWLLAAASTVLYCQERNSLFGSCQDLVGVICMYRVINL